MCNIVSREDLGSVFGAAAGELRGHAAWAYGADTDAVAAQVFGHTTAETLEGPLGGAVDAASSEGVFPCERGDVDDVTVFALDHARNNGATDQKHAFEIGV